MAGGPAEIVAPEGLDDSEWMEDRDVFAWEIYEQNGQKGRRLYITEQAKRRWDKKNPTRFTPETALEIVQHCSVGATKTDAAAAVGIVRQTLKNWLDRAANKEQSTEELRAFAAWLDRARAMRRVEAIRRISKAGAEDANHEKWYLERSDPDNWCRRETVSHVGPGGGPLQTEDVTADITKMNSEQRWKEFRRLSQKAAIAVAEENLKEDDGNPKE